MNENKKRTFRQKFEDFWYYNKWFTILGCGLAILLILGVWVIVDEYNSSPYDLRVTAVYTDKVTKEAYDMDQRLKDGLNEINNDGEINVVYKEYSLVPGTQTDSDMMTQGRFEADLKNCNGDILLFDKPNLDMYLKKDIFSPIGDYLDLSTINDEDIIYKNGTAVAVKLSDSKILQDMKYNTDEIYMSVMYLKDSPDAQTLASRENAKIAIKKLTEPVNAQ